MDCPRAPVDGLESLRIRKRKGKERARKEEKQEEEKKKPSLFMWEDDEVELLLQCTAAYKVEKAAEGVDWEWIRNRYDEITDLYKERVYSADVSAGKAYKHGKEGDHEQAKTHSVEVPRGRR